MINEKDIKDYNQIKNEIEQLLNSNSINKYHVICIEYIYENKIIDKLIEASFGKEAVDDCKNELEEIFSQSIVDKCVYILKNITLNRNLSTILGSSYMNYIDDLKMLANDGDEAQWSKSDVWDKIVISDDKLKDKWVRLFFKSFILELHKRNQDEAISETEIYHWAKEYLSEENDSIVHTLIEFEKNSFEIGFQLSQSFDTTAASDTVHNDDRVISSWEQQFSDILEELIKH